MKFGDNPTIDNWDPFNFNNEKQRIFKFLSFLSEDCPLLMNKLALFCRKFKQCSNHKATNRVGNGGKFRL